MGVSSVLRRGTLDRSGVQALLLELHQDGCSEDGLSRLAGELSRAGDYGCVVISLGDDASAIDLTGRAGSHTAWKWLAERVAGGDSGRSGRSARSWPIEDPLGNTVGRVEYLLGRDLVPPSADETALIEQVCTQLGVMARLARLEQHACDSQQWLAEEQSDRRLAEQAFDLLFDESAIAMATVDLDAEHAGRFVAANEAMCRLIGYTSAELMQLTSTELTHPEDRASHASALRRAVEGRRTPVRGQRRLVGADGTAITVRVTACALFDEDDQPLYGLLQIEDLRPATAATVSPARPGGLALNGLLSSAELEQRMAVVLDRAHRLNTTGAVLICELNPALGPTGTRGAAELELMRTATAAALGRTLREGDLIARTGENRFAVVAEEIAADHVSVLAQRITDALAGICTSVQVGISVLGAGAADPHLLLQRASSAMLDARAGGPTYLLYSRTEARAERIITMPREVLYATPGWRTD